MPNAPVYTQGDYKAAGGGTIATPLSYARTPPQLPKHTGRGERRTQGANYYTPTTAPSPPIACVPALNAHTIVQGGDAVHVTAGQ